MKDGDRVFAAGPRDSSQHLFSIKIVQEDIDVIQEYDICHTSCYSNLEYELPLLQKICRVSFDFSERRDLEYLERTCPYLDFAFFSGSDLTEERLWIMRQNGPRLPVRFVEGSDIHISCNIL